MYMHTCMHALGLKWQGTRGSSRAATRSLSTFPGYLPEHPIRLIFLVISLHAPPLSWRFAHNVWRGTSCAGAASNIIYIYYYMYTKHSATQIWSQVALTQASAAFWRSSTDAAWASQRHGKDLAMVSGSPDCTNNIVYIIVCVCLWMFGFVKTKNSNVTTFDISSPHAYCMHVTTCPSPLKQNGGFLKQISPEYKHNDLIWG